MSAFTLRQLQYFRSIAATGSISAAASRERVSRSAIAAALDDLERNLGQQLCTRYKSRGIELTAAGHEVLSRATSLLAEAEELEAIGSDTDLVGAFTVGCFASLAPTILPTMLRLFEQLHPRARLNFVVGSEDVLLDKLYAGEIELIIAYNRGPNRTLTTVELYQTRMHVILAGDHPLAAAETVPVAALKDEPLILMDTPPSADDILGYFASQGIAPDVRHRTSHFELARALVGAGLGYSLFIQLPKIDLSYEGKPVVARPLDPPPHLETAQIAWVADRRLSAKARTFIALAREHVDAYAPVAVYPE
jgi:DNA-binding transcriptional LysR family regulator